MAQAADPADPIARATAQSGPTACAAGLTAGDVGNFLESVQNLVFSNALNNTYKLALIQSIADAALDDSRLAAGGGTTDLVIGYDRLAERFLELYWPQTNCFTVERDDGRGNIKTISRRLAQGANQGQLKIFSLIEAFCHDVAKKAGKPAQAGAAPTAGITCGEARRRDKEAFARLVRNCRNLVVVKNPLQYISGCEFLFSNDKVQGALVVPAKHAQLLRRFHPMITELIRTRWEARIRSLERNAELLAEGSAMSLRDFLFNQERAQNLSTARKIISEVTKETKCFYCGCPLTPGITHVDHFLAYRYFQPMRIHNFVLACERCNTSKSDTLADGEHVGNWVDRNLTYAVDLRDAARSEDFPNETAAFYSFVRDTYRNALVRGEAFWLRCAGKKGPVKAVYPDEAGRRAFILRFEPLFDPAKNPLIRP